MKKNGEKHRRLAVLGGTFDPVHYGHLALAEAALHQLRAEKVLFVPSGNPPHKADTPVTENEHRYLMTVLATAENPSFEVSRVEIEKKGFSYTVDTIGDIKGLYGEGCKVFFITGSDEISQLGSWKEPERLAGLCVFAVAYRPGYGAAPPAIPGLEIRKIEAPELAVSSSGIRSMIAEGRPVRYLLPDNVIAYMEKNGLYQKNRAGLTGENIKLTNCARKIRPRFSEKRYAHILGVANEAMNLAQAHGIDKDKAYLTGLLHDLAKEYSQDEMLGLCEKYGVYVDDIIKEQPDLAHSFLSAYIAESEFDITDGDILNAISYHTTGRREMSPLEKIIYISDCIEPSRKYEGVTELREDSRSDIDGAMVKCLTRKMEYTRTKNKRIHPFSIQALEFYRAR